MNDKEILKKFNITEEEILKMSEEMDNENFENWDLENVYYVDPIINHLPKKTLSFSVPINTAESIEIRSNKENITKSEFLRRAVNRELAITSN